MNMIKHDLILINDTWLCFSVIMFWWLMMNDYCIKMYLNIKLWLIVINYN